MQDFYNFLRELGIIDAPDVFEVIRKMKHEEVTELAKQCYLLTEKRPHIVSPSLFNFSVNSSIPGGMHRCAEINCRLNTSHAFSIFSAMYAETVYLPNFFEHIYHNLTDGFDFENEDQYLNFEKRLAGDIVLMFNLRPLFEAGILRINPQLGAYCNGCLQKKREDEEKLNNQFSHIEEEIIPLLAEKVKLTLGSDGALFLGDPDNYLNSEVLKFSIVPKELKKYVKKYRYTLSSEDALKLKPLWAYFLNPIFNDLAVQKFTTNSLDLNYLTDKKLEAEIIDRMAQSDTKLMPKNLLVKEVIQELPFIENISLESLVKLRAKEHESFIVYRDNIRLAIKEVQNLATPYEAKQIVDDVINPAINKIDQIIKNNRNSFIKQGVKKIAYNSLILSAGLFADKFSGIDMSKILGALGAYKGTEIFGDFSNSTKKPEAVLNNNYYFLWKIKNSSK